MKKNFDFFIGILFSILSIAYLYYFIKEFTLDTFVILIFAINIAGLSFELSYLKGRKN